MHYDTVLGCKAAQLINLLLYLERRVLRGILNRFKNKRCVIKDKDFCIVLTCLHYVWKEKWLRLDLPTWGV